MYDAVYLMNSRGAVLLSRAYGNRQVPTSHLAEFKRALFSRVYVQSAPPVLCVGDAKDKTTFIYVSVGASETIADMELVNASFVGLDASLRRTDVALKHRGAGGIVAAVACRGNPNAALALVMLRRLLSLLQECASRAAAPSTALSALGIRRSAGDLKESFLVTHADLVFEILDEAIDRGVPQTSDPKVLLLLAEATAGARNADTSEGAAKLAAQVTRQTAWRGPGIRYRRNQLVIEVVEKLHVLVGQNGTVLRQEVEGKVIARSFLSGMPECKLTTNEVVGAPDRPAAGSRPRIQAITNAPLPGAAAEAARNSAAAGSTVGQGPTGVGSVVAQRVVGEGYGGPLPVGAKGSVKLSGCSYHHCVRLAKHAAEKTIAFTPPDGECEIMTYRCKEDITIPIKVCPFFYERKKGQFEYLVFLKALYPGNLTARNIEVIVPTPPEVSVMCVLQSSWGKSDYDSSQLAVVWKLPKFPGGCEYVLRFLLEVSSPPSPVRGPLRLTFSLPGMTASGLCIRQLRVTEKSNYVPSKCIRYLTESGQYEHRGHAAIIHSVTEGECKGFFLFMQTYQQH